MSDIELVRVTGRNMLDSVLTASGLNVARTDLQDIRHRAPRFFHQLQSGEPNIVVINTDSVSSLDVMSLRWMFPAGVTPLVLCPSTPQECADLAEIAVSAAQLIPGPVFLLIEDAVANAEDIMIPTTQPSLEMNEIDPSDMLNLPEAERNLRSLDARLNAGFKGHVPTLMDACPGKMGKPEWLLISYGHTSIAAKAAADTAREEGQRVNHLRLRQLWPLPEEALIRALMGIKHIVVAEPNLGQYASEIRRLAPEVTVIPAGGLGEVKLHSILERLQRTPRCC